MSHWSIDQCEYATDIVFRRQADLGAIYENLTRTAIHSVKPDNIATFLGTKLHGNYHGVVNEEYAVSGDGMKMLGVLDLETQMECCRFAVGVRNSHDKSLRLGLCCGVR